MKKRILVAALDWGLGHATRSVPVIRKLQEEGYEVILASAGSAADFYRTYFPEIKLLSKPGYEIRYYNIPLAISVLFQVPKITLAIIREHRWLKKIILTENIDAVISDNCYGLYHRDIHSTLITHQLQIICPPALKIFTTPLRSIIRWFVNKFDECHIPDHEGTDNLSGDLSHVKNLPANSKFIGPLSRFAGMKINPANENFEIAILISGPEPQRTFFENKCRKFLTGTKSRVCIVRGLPGDAKTISQDGITFVNHADDISLANILTSSSRIICRSGYSTIMDLEALNLPAVLVPTPGQPEQEYLAEYLSAKKKYVSVKQDALTREVLNEFSILHQAL